MKDEKIPMCDLLNKRITKLESNWKKLKDCISKEQERLVKETSNVYYDSLDEAHNVNEDIYDELSKIYNEIHRLEEI